VVGFVQVNRAFLQLKSRFNPTVQSMQSRDITNSDQKSKFVGSGVSITEKSTQSNPKEDNNTEVLTAEKCSLTKKKSQDCLQTSGKPIRGSPQKEQTAPGRLL
jgi:hypothetical protein